MTIMMATDLPAGDIDLRVGGTIGQCGCGALTVAVDHPELVGVWIDLDSPGGTHVCPAVAVELRLTVHLQPGVHSHEAMSHITQTLLDARYEGDCPLDHDAGMILRLA